MEEMTVEEIAFHYYKKLMQIQDEIQVCRSLLKEIHTLSEESREGDSAERMRSQLEDLIGLEADMVHFIDRMIGKISGNSYE